jgi:NRAMP (natural resistance-associated macrophage protein)-like metal ion transporter
VAPAIGFRLSLPRIALFAVLGPGIVSGFADNDAGGITTYSVVGAQFGYSLLWVVLASMLAPFVTQAAGARLGLATGRCLLDLIRENFGIRWGALALTTMIVANLGTTVAEFAGIGAALSLFGIPVVAADAIAVVSAVLARPDWGRSATSLLVPHGALGSAYLLAVVGTVGTTITP